MRTPLPGLARLTLALATAALPAIAQPVRKDAGVTKPTTTTTSTGVVARDSMATTPTFDPATTALVSSIQSDANAIGLLHAANVAEIDAARLAQQRTTNADVKAFADRMVADHTALDQQGSMLGMQLGVTPMLPDSTFPHMAADASAKLGAAMTDFDRMYLAQQVADHQHVLAIVDAAIAKAQHVELRNALEGQVRPKVAEHLRMAQDLQRKIGGP